MLFSKKRKTKNENDLLNGTKDHDFSSLMNSVRHDSDHLKSVQAAFDRLKKDYTRQPKHH